MSVLVKGMKMPENCGECRMNTEIGFCSAMSDNFCGYTDDRKRPDWCPLVELPEKHGRLIDGDLLLDDVRKHSESYFADDFAHEWVDVQPTVIEAEEVEE